MNACYPSLAPAVRTIEGVVNYTASCKIVIGAYNLSARIFTFTKSSATTLIGKVITPLSSRWHKNKLALLQRKDYVGSIAKIVQATLKTIPQITHGFIKNPKGRYIFELTVLGMGEAMAAPLLLMEPEVMPVGVALLGLALWLEIDPDSEELAQNAQKPVIIRIFQMLLRVKLTQIVFTKAKKLMSDEKVGDCIGFSVGLVFSMMIRGSSAFYDLEKLIKVFKTNLQIVNRYVLNLEIVNRYNLKIAVHRELRNLDTSMELRRRAFDDESCAIVSNYIGLNDG